MLNRDFVISFKRFPLSEVLMYKIGVFFNIKSVKTKSQDRKKICFKRAFVLVDIIA